MGKNNRGQENLLMGHYSRVNQSLPEIVKTSECLESSHIVPNVCNSSTNEVMHCIAELHVNRMCNAMEIENAVAGDANASMMVPTDVKHNGDNDTVALGHRTSQPLKDFFVPVSQREKPSKKLGEEPNLAPPPSVEDVAKKKRGRPRKTSMEDGSRDFFVPLSAKEKPKKISSIDAILSPAPVMVAEDGAVNGGKLRVKLTEDYGSDFFVPVSKRDRSDKELSRDEASTLEITPIRAEEGVKKRGRPRKSSLESEGNALNGSSSGVADDILRPRRGKSTETSLDGPQSVTTPGIFQDSINLKQGRPRTRSMIEREDVARSSGSLEGTQIFSGPSAHEIRVSQAVVAAQKVNEPQIVGDAQAAGTSLMQNDRENQGQETQDPEGKQVAPGSGSQDHHLSQVTRDDFFVPVSKRRKRKEELVDKKSDVTGKVPPKPTAQKYGQAEKRAVESVHDVPMLQTLLGKENVSVATGLPSKETASSIPCTTIVREEHDLRVEAVLAAQEIARLNAGRAPHPFFARKKVLSLKTSVPWDEVPTCQADDLQPGPPMHLTQLSEDERTNVVWPDWKVRCTSGDDDSRLEVSKVEPKRSPLMRLSLPSIGAELVQRPDSHALSTNDSELSGSPARNGEERSSDGDETAFFLKDLQEVLQNVQRLKMTTEDVEELARSPEVCQKADGDLSLENLKNRLLLYTARHEVLSSAENVTTSQISKESDGEAVLSTRNVLWTDLYQPRSSKEVCGNTTAVEGLNTWLYKWQLKITGQLDENKGLKRDRNADYDSDRGWFEGDSDYDSDDVDNETGLHNTLLVTGPEGCGKSAAVYACAGEQGFTVIEVNASDCRNGALIKQKFGEAMESHGLGKGSQLGVESPEPASKKGVNTQERKLFAEKRADGRSPLKAQPERLTASQDESQMDSQSKRKTVILFEDVDKTFDEDKGFVTALVQLSKTTKRPIILTSNRYEPGLPPALEKCRADFHYLSSEELVLHTCLVAIAEGVPCSPWLLERLVDSCHYDLRKVMMALQFWGQGKLPLHQPSILWGPPGLVKTPNHLENQQLNGQVVRNNLSLEHKSIKLNGSSKLTLSHNHGQGCFDHWEPNARWLFELDVHHFILPKVLSGSFECPFTLLVGKKINTAVLELEDHMAQVAAVESEARARAKQAEYECVELTRKALKKEKDALRRASQSNPRVLDDAGMSSLPPDEDEELENGFGENWACSPVKSLREAKTLARSPLKSRRLKSRRVLLLCDSDDDEAPSLKVESSGLQTGETVTEDHLVSSEVRRRILAEDGERPLLVSNANDRPTTDFTLLLSGGSETSASLQIRGQQATQNFDPSGENPVLSISLSGDEQRLENSSIDTRAVERSTFVTEGNYVCESGLISNHGLQSCSREVLLKIEDGLQGSEVMVPPKDLSRGLLGSLQNVSESPRQTVVAISLSTGLDDQMDAEGSVAPVFEPVNDAWASLRNSQQAPNSLLKDAETSADVASSLADLLDIVSASDVISYVQPEELKDAWRNFDGNCSEAFEGNIGHSSDWDNCQEIASQLVCTGLQLSLPFLPAVNHADDRLPVLSCILECAKDAPAVGKCMVTHFGLTRGSHQSSSLCRMVDNVSAKSSLIRQGLEDVVQAAVFPRGRVSESAFVEYSAYLSRMSKLEEIRRTNGIVQGRRPRRFEHHLTSKLKSLSDSDIMELLKYSTFKSS